MFVSRIIPLSTGNGRYGPRFLSYHLTLLTELPLRPVIGLVTLTTPFQRWRDVARR